MKSDNLTEITQDSELHQATKKDRSSKSSTTEIVVVVDLGASKTKVIFQEYPDSEPQVICIQSEVADVSLDSLKSLEVGGHPEDNCWVSLPNSGSYALGYLARYKFGGLTMLRSLKFDLALPKIAGVLWVVSQKLSKKTKVLKVRLCVLLPPSEGGDSKALEEKIKQELEEFTTPTGTLRVKLLDFKATREGYGIACYRRNILGDDKFKQRNIAVVMVGYRNLSVLEFVRGKLLEGASCDLGMSWMVDTFVKECGAGLSVDDPKVLQALVDAGADCDSTVLSKLSRKRNNSEQTADGAKFSLVARKARDNYALAVIRWLSQNIPEETDEIIFCGGTARYISDKLCEYYDGKEIPVEWDGGIVVPKVLDKLEMGERLADVFGLYQYYVNKLDELKKKDGAARLPQMIEAADRAEKEAVQKAKTEAAQKEKAHKIAQLVAQIKEAKKNKWEPWWLEEQLYKLTDGKQGRLI
ncbi:ParM/StbA family protein [Brasilonema sp. UFV-L1]|uniref:ParM/StbA family protein n=1 Tax=Brasilonema sp. UFV-L1 TaxID=2234130 RepID=UPI00145EE630|nr:ParM/StbA family protein [Brasilonema sp. UFV-L1]NMG11913.1 hypothetical protein [Brasilonema sp. UFV-L1]